MRLGAVFPQLEIGADPGAVRDYLCTVEDLGFRHVVVFDHVLGADVDRVDERMTSWPPNHYTHLDTFHEPFVLLGFAAACTSRLELVTGVLVLPQRQTALVAKQAAEVDILSGGGRLRLGVGTGWNHLEYEALGMEFAARGAMLDEQVRVLRALWTQALVEHDGRFHRLSRVGIAPPPPTPRPPLWFGGSSRVAVRRAVREGEGLLIMGGPRRDVTLRTVDLVRDELDRQGRDGSTFGLEGRVDVPGKAVEELAAEIAFWQERGATHLAFNTMARVADPEWRSKPLQTVDDHAIMLRRVLDAAEAVLGQGP